MKCKILLPILLICVFPSARAQVSGDGERKIMELEAERFRAMQTVDVAALDRILSDDLVYTHANGLRQTKDDVIGVLASRDMKYESITPEDTRVRIYGDTAVLTGHANVKINAQGQDQSFKICYLDVYVKQEGRWQMVAWQSSRIAP